MARPVRSRWVDVKTRLSSIDALVGSCDPLSWYYGHLRRSARSQESKEPVLNHHGGGQTNY